MGKTKRITKLVSIVLILILLFGCSTKSIDFNADNCFIIKNYPEEQNSIIKTFSETQAGVNYLLLQTNNLRKESGINSLKFNDNLSVLAYIRAKEISKSGKHSHFRPDGTYFSSVFTENQITDGKAGENIAWGLESPEDIFNALCNSSKHKENMLNKQWQYAGICLFPDADSDTFTSVELFSSRNF